MSSLLYFRTVTEGRLREKDRPLADREADYGRERYGAYELRWTGEKREPVCIAATPRLEGVGLMLATMADDRDEWHREHGGLNIVPVLAIFDRVERRWFTSLWYPKEKEG
jgi:hypothetical protein